MENVVKSNLVPFGKYRGRPVEEMAVDREYCDWLMAQPWFSERYRDVYHVVVNYGGEPQDSPEHNQLQARLLDDEFCMSVIWSAWRHSIDPAEQIAKWSKDEQDDINSQISSGECRSVPYVISARQFEHKGWDCLVRIKGGLVYGEHDWSVTGIERWLFGIECKPTIGEEYPSILRQVKGLPAESSEFGRIVLTQATTMQSVPAETVVKMFASSGIQLVVVP